MLADVLGEEGGREVGARDGEADADVAAPLVPEARVDADVDRLARVREGPDPGPDVDLLAPVQRDRVDRADHPPLGLLDVGRNRCLPERLRDHQLEELVAGLHPAPPLGNDRELEPAGVLVELADQRVHPARVEARPVQAVERGEDSHVGRIAPKGAAPDLRELLDVVGAYVPRARLEGHHVAQLRGWDLLGHHADRRPNVIGVAAATRSTANTATAAATSADSTPASRAWMRTPRAAPTASPMASFSGRRPSRPRKAPLMIAVIRASSGP